MVMANLYDNFKNESDNTIKIEAFRSYQMTNTSRIEALQASFQHFTLSKLKTILYIPVSICFLFNSLYLSFLFEDTCLLKEISGLVLKLIRSARAKYCSCNRECPVKECSLYAYRMGKRPKRISVEKPEEIAKQKQDLVEEINLGIKSKKPDEKTTKGLF